MATKKTPVTEEDIAMPGVASGELDQAIDDLRGVLKADSDGVPGFDADFGNVGGDLSPAGSSDFGAEFGSDLAGADSSAAGLADFGGGDFGGSDFGNTDFGGSDLGGSGFGGASMDEPTFSGGVQEPGSALAANLDLIMDIPIDVEIVLGSSRMQVSGLMNLEEGATIALDKKIGEPVEIMVNGRRIGKGEITVLDNDDTRFGVKVTEVLSTKRA
ncbi:flagellar motor switch protein FliN [Pseudorhizobium banfieldiae]|uniref:flagellar motor switch protein FliN n=1 Tax=Pseudorhizobium banfieldiae TaxID=1125847 RepID=UPI000696C1C0|nr:flagellar motor switch protein FliN [Pseudorhizobium banfieldiae]CAD6598906.1 flagellar motor switch protein FliN [arsenite-oxidising bacterium NT-25]